MKTITYTDGALKLLYFLQRHDGWQSIRRSEYKNVERLEVFGDVEIIRHAKPALWQVRLANHWQEYDGAAQWCADRGLKGAIGEPLPENMGSPGAIDYINADPEAFQTRVRQFAYAKAMQGHPDYSNTP